MLFPIILYFLKSLILWFFFYFQKKVLLKFCVSFVSVSNPVNFLLIELYYIYIYKIDCDS